jgi:hypothetical protein
MPLLFCEVELKLHAFSVRTILLVTDPWALPTAIQFHAFGVSASGTPSHRVP